MSGVDYRTMAMMNKGKKIIANAITDKGIDTNSNDSFDTMAENISNIVSGGGEPIVGEFKHFSGETIKAQHTLGNKPMKNVSVTSKFGLGVGNGDGKYKVTLEVNNGVNDGISTYKKEEVDFIIPNMLFGDNEIRQRVDGKFEFVETHGTFQTANKFNGIASPIKEDAFKCRSMICIEGVLYIFGCTNIISSHALNKNRVYKYNPLENQWIRISEAPFALPATCVQPCYHNGHVYFVSVGGLYDYDVELNSWTLLDDTYKTTASLTYYDNKLYAICTSSRYYDLETKVWTLLPNLPNMNYGTNGNVLYGDSIYIFGGDQGVTKYFKYNIPNATFDYLGVMPIRIGNCSTILIDDKVYICCHYSDNGSSNATVTIYDITNNKWSNGVDAPLYMHDTRTTIYNGKIICCGLVPRTNGYFNDYDNFIFQIYDYINDCWENTSNFQPNISGLSHFSTCRDGNNVYIIGGRNGKNVPIKNFRKYNVLTKELVELEELPVAIHQHQSVLVNNKIYVLGAYESDMYNNMYVYDLELGGGWSIKSVPYAIRQQALAVHGDEFYSIQGYYSSNRAYVYKYNTITDTWTSCANCTFTNLGAKAHVYNGKIYLVSGTNWVCMCYDIASNTWTTLNKPSTSHTRASSFMINDEIYVVGGTLAEDATIEKYNIPTNTWTKVIDLPRQFCSGDIILHDGELQLLYGSGTPSSSGDTFWFDTISYNMLNSEPKEPIVYPLDTPKIQTFKHTTNMKPKANNSPMQIECDIEIEI